MSKSIGNASIRDFRGGDNDAFSAVCVAAGGSGAGKTTVVLALLAALKRRGMRVTPFKCGPDYIDPSHHKAICGTPSRNLDTWMMGGEGARRTFANAAAKSDVAVVEGVMGLFDASSPTTLSGSTADVAATLGVPVLLVLDAKGMAGTIAPIAKGLAEFDPRVEVVGVVANNVGSSRHADILRVALDANGAPPLLGYLTRDEELSIPERHLGLTPASEHAIDSALEERLADAAERCFDIDGILAASRQPVPIPLSFRMPDKRRGRVALALDEAFHFYYDDNLDILRHLGYEIVHFSPIADESLPSDIDWVFIGGGFPECFADRLRDNSSMRRAIAEFAAGGGMIYAECGGLMYLSNSLTDTTGRCFEMCGVIPVDTTMESRLRSLGYREARVLDGLPFADAGAVLRGHEFHWSSARPTKASDVQPFLEVRGASGGEWTPAGFRKGNVFASYVHLYLGLTE